MPSNPASNVLLLQPLGTGPDLEPPYDPLGIGKRRRRQNGVTGRQWFSPIVYYVGPFGEEVGLDGSGPFFRRANAYGKPPQVYLTATETGLGIVPARRRRAEALWTTYDRIGSIELRPGAKARKIAMTPRTAVEIGETVMATTDKRRAHFTGTPVNGLFRFLLELGATVGSNGSMSGR